MKKAIAMAFVLVAVCVASGADSDAKRMNSEAMNPKGLGSLLERAEGNSLRVLIYGNSIALHNPLPSIGWTNRWGMAASSEDRDFAHLVVAGLERMRGRRADFRIRNLATCERNFKASPCSSQPELADDIAYSPDYVVIAIGENVPGLDEDSAWEYTRLLVAIAKPLCGGAKKPKVVMRSPFWPNRVKAECTAKAAAEVGAMYVDASPIGAREENMAIGLFSHNGVARHPGDLGMKRLAELILSAFSEETQNNQKEH